MEAQTVHVAALDTRISVAYQQRAFVAEQIFPLCPVQKLSDKYTKYSKQSFRAVVDTLDQGGYPRSYALDLEPYGYFNCLGHGVEVSLSDVARRNADNAAEIDMVHQNFVRGLIALAREIEVINLINTTNIPQNATLSGTSLWSNAASDPIAAMLAQIETIEQSTGLGPDNMRLLLPRPVWRTIKTHPTVRDYVKYTQNLMQKPVIAANLASALEINSVVIADNIGLTSVEGQTDALAYNWGNIALLYSTTGAPSRLTPNFGYIFYDQPDSYPLKRVRNERNDSDIFKSQEYRDTILVEPNAAFLWNTPI